MRVMTDMHFELRRKLFHAAGAAYGAVFLLFPPEVFVRVLAGVFAGVAVVEFARLRIPAVAAFSRRLFGSLMRASEVGALSGVFWMSLGALACGLLLMKHPRLASACMFYLVFGDGVASLVGKWIKGPQWPGFQKTLSGSAACFLACLLVGLVLLRGHYGMDGIVAGALVATIVEIPPSRLNDNFLMPVMTAVFFLFWLGR